MSYYGYSLSKVVSAVDMVLIAGTSGAVVGVWGATVGQGCYSPVVVL